MEKTEFDSFFVSLKTLYESASFPSPLKLQIENEEALTEEQLNDLNR